MPLRVVKEYDAWVVYDDENPEICGRGKDRAVAIQTAQEAKKKRNEVDKKQYTNTVATPKEKGVKAIERYRDAYNMFCDGVEYYAIPAALDKKKNIKDSLDKRTSLVRSVLTTEGLAEALGLSATPVETLSTIIKTLGAPEDPHAYFESKKEENQQYLEAIKQIERAIDFESSRKIPPRGLVFGDPPERAVEPHDSVLDHLKKARDTLQGDHQKMMSELSIRIDLVGSKKGGHGADSYHRTLVARSVLENLPNDTAKPYKLTADIMRAAGIKITSAEVRSVSKMRANKAHYC